MQGVTLFSYFSGKGQRTHVFTTAFVYSRGVYTVYVCVCVCIELMETDIKTDMDAELCCAETQASVGIRSG